MVRATFTVGVFGLACWNVGGTLLIKVNVRTDQEAQRKKIGLADPSVRIVDLPGGGVEIEDLAGQENSLLGALRREINEETGGCSIEPVGKLSVPYLAVSDKKGPDGQVGDLAFWLPILLKGKPRPTAEALDHPWISLQQLEAATEYRVVAGLAKTGRSGQMLRAAFAFYDARKGSAEFFSVPD
jgi:hypothetical protein